MPTVVTDMGVPGSRRGGRTGGSIGVGLGSSSLSKSCVKECTLAFGDSFLNGSFLMNGLGGSTNGSGGFGCGFSGGSYVPSMMLGTGEGLNFFFLPSEAGGDTYFGLIPPPIGGCTGNCTGGICPMCGTLPVPLSPVFCCCPAAGAPRPGIPEPIACCS